ncbi:hypothetical protein SAXI111661_02775 [Saccharomonospora xinjiangensis]
MAAADVALAGAHPRRPRCHRRGRERPHHRRLRGRRDRQADAGGVLHLPRRRAHDVPRPAAARADRGAGRRLATGVHGHRCRHLRLTQPVLRGHLRRPADRQLRQHRNLWRDHDEPPHGAAGRRFLRVAGTRAEGADRGARHGQGGRARRRGRGVGQGPHRDARLPQPAGGHRRRAAGRLVPHGGSRRQGRAGVSDHHGPDQGTDHPWWGEHPSRRDRGRREHGRRCRRRGRRGQAGRRTRRGARGVRGRRGPR